MAPHSSTLAWKVPWMEEPGGLQSMGSLRIVHDWATSLSLFTFMRWRKKGQPTPVFLPGESQNRGAWWAAVYWVAQSRTRLKWLSSSSSIFKYSRIFKTYLLTQMWKSLVAWVQTTWVVWFGWWKRIWTGNEKAWVVILTPDVFSKDISSHW